MTRTVSPGSAQSARATEASSTTAPVSVPAPVPLSPRASSSGRGSQLPAVTSGRPVSGGVAGAARSVTPTRAPRDSTVVAVVRKGPERAATPSTPDRAAMSAPARVCSQMCAPWDWLKIRCQGFAA